VPPQLRELLVCETVRGAHLAKESAQPRPLALPAADAHVHVVALRKDPAVAAGDDPQLEDEATVVALLRRGAVRDVALERDAVRVVAAEAERAGGDAVRAVGSDQRGG